MPRTPTLDTGDKYTYSLSATVRPAPGVVMTARVTVSGRVRRTESANKAAGRIESFVQNRLNDKINELMMRDEQGSR